MRKSWCFRHDCHAENEKTGQRSRAWEGLETVHTLLTDAYRLYRNGFRSMTLGKTLWKIILIKLFVMFAILKLFFFPDFLQSNFSNDQERADHVLEQLTGPARNN